MALTAAAAAQSGSSGESGWRVQAGYVHQWGRGMSVSGPAPSISAGDLSFAPLGGRAIRDGLPTATYPDNSLLIPRTFDDGYVLPDLWTDDTGLLGTDRYGMTWNWGVDSAGQYDYNNGVHPTLAFHISDQQVVMGNATVSGSTTDDDMPNNGVEIRFGRTLIEWDGNGPEDEASGAAWWNTPASVDAVLGLAWFPEVDQRVARQAGRTVYNVTETYTYSDYYGANGEGPLDVPWSGTYDGSGSLIPATPSDWGYALDPLGTARDRVAVDSQLWHLRGAAGLALTKAVTPHWSVYVLPQAVLELVDMSATRRETLTYTDGQTGQTSTLASRADHKSGFAVVPGFLLTGGLDYRTDSGWYAGTSLGWEWLAEDPGLHVGPDRVRFDLDGGEFSLYVGRNF